MDNSSQLNIKAQLLVVWNTVARITSPTAGARECCGFKARRQSIRSDATEDACGISSQHDSKGKEAVNNAHDTEGH